MFLRLRFCGRCRNVEFTINITGRPKGVIINRGGNYHCIVFAVKTAMSGCNFSAFWISNDVNINSKFKLGLLFPAICIYLS